jgi:hypothetical protein
VTSVGQNRGMTGIAPEDAETIAADDDRPHAPAVARLAVVAAALVGAAAVLLYGWTSAEGWQLLISLAILVAGVVIGAVANDPDIRRTWVLGRWVLAGIGAAGVVLGAYLAGTAMVALSIPDGPFFRGEQPDLPSPVMILLLLYGVPLIALIVLAVHDRPAGLVGTGVVAPVLAVSVLAAAGASASVVSIASVVVAIACVPLAMLLASRWGSLVILVGMMAASFAVGAGVSPFGTLATSTSRPAAEATEAEAAVGTLPVGLVPVVLVCALGAAAVLLILAVSRRDMAGGLVGGALFAVPPAYLLIPTLMTGGGIDLSRSLALAAIPLVVLLIALAAWWAPALRDVLTRAFRLSGAHSAAFAAAAGVAAVVLVVYSLTAFGWPSRLSGVITLVVLVAAAVLAVRLPGTAGAALAGVTLVGLQLGAPWVRVLNGDQGLRNGLTDLWVAAVVGLVVAVAAAVVLIARHRRAGVWAAAAYLLAGTMADLLWALVGADQLSLGDEGQVAVMAIVVGPLLLLGIPAAIAAIRGSAAGQAAGSVLVAAGAFIPLYGVVSQISSNNDPNTDVALQFSLAPFTPTNTQGAARLLDAGAWTFFGVMAMLLLSLVLLASTVRRPSAPLTAAVTLAVVIATQVATISALEAWGLDGTEGAVWIFVGLAVALGVVAIMATAAAGHRRYESSSAGHGEEQHGET